MKLDELYSSLTIKTGAKLALIVLDMLPDGALRCVIVSGWPRGNAPRGRDQANDSSAPR